MVNELLPNRWVRWGVALAFWSLVALVSTLHWRYYPMGEYPYTWWELLRAKLLVWMVWGALTPLILWIAGRFRIEREHSWLNALWLLLISFPVTLLYLMAYSKLVILNIPEMQDIWQFKPMFDFVISRHSTYYYLAFWALVGLEHALGFYRRYHERALLATRLESRLAQARLDRLRDQLHPHFLFNALNTISSMILKDKKLLAYDTLTSLSELLRISLERSDRQWTTLKEEIEFSRLYLELLAARFPDNLPVEWQIQDEALECVVPCLLLQPLVENCVTHGAAREDGGGSIAVSAGVASGDRLAIRISNAFSDTADDSSGAGLGLRQVRETLQHLYGDDFLFQHANDGGTFRVELEVPLRFSAREQIDVLQKD